jgi:3-ketosteroid 9alpha-monooxygenase subunit B
VDVEQRRGGLKQKGARSVPIVTWSLTVADATAETADSATIVVDPSHGGAGAYQPGQFLTLRVPSDRTGFVARCYSLCSSPSR